MKLAALISGGKDSWYAAYEAQKQGHEVVCLVTLIPEKDDSYMFHFPNVEFVEKQAEAADLPLIQLPTKGVKEKELEDLKQAINLAKQKYHIEGICSGAVASQYQKERVDNIAEELELKSIAPIWHIEPMLYMQNIVLKGFDTIIVGIAADGLDESYLGRKIDRDVVQLMQRTKIHLAGEGGEYETFVLDCPLFKKKLEVWDSFVQIENNCTGKLIIKEIQLLKK